MKFTMTAEWSANATPNLGLAGLGLILSAIATPAALIVWIAPEERAFGAGIKWRYVHMALTWTGMTGVVVAGMLGVLAATGYGRRFGRKRRVHFLFFGRAAT